MPANTQDLDDILKIRSEAKNIKCPDPAYTQQHIQEFVRAIILSNKNTVGIMRLFELSRVPYTLEMGSFVKTKSASVPGMTQLS